MKKTIMYLLVVLVISFVWAEPALEKFEKEEKRPIVVYEGKNPYVRAVSEQRTPDSRECCDFEIILYDTYGDGWNGNTIDVLVNGNVVLDDITLASGSGPESFTIPNVCDVLPDTISTIYNQTGNYPDENWYEIYDNDGFLVAESHGSSPNGPPDVEVEVLCASCSVPGECFANVITSNSAVLNWTIGDSEPNWNIFWGEVGFNPLTEGILISNTTDNPYTLTGLTTDTSYDWYVQADCDGTAAPSDDSNWVGPFTFTTLLICLPPTNPITNFISPTSASLVRTNGGTEPNWNILWGEIGFDPDIEGILISNTPDNPYILTGLTEGTNYDWYVQADCDGTAMSGDESVWIGPNAINPGESWENAIVISALPFNDKGDTSGFIDDYDEACPYSGSTSPDVVYSYTPIENMYVDISLCDSTYYDSKLYVYENTVTLGTAIACNDDACTSSVGVSLVSALTDLLFIAGNTYYIVVDGYGSDSGIYEIDVTKVYFADFISSTVEAYIGEEIQFTDNTGGSPISWEWDVENDGIYDYFVQNPTHIYRTIGTYSVKLRVSDGTVVDSLIQENLIAVEYASPAEPQNVQVEIVYPDAVISWAAVDTTIFGDPIIPDGYIVLFSENEEDYFYLISTSDTTYTHIRVAEHREIMFYQVLAYINYTREQIEYLASLNNSRENIKWADVKRNLNVKRK